MIYVKEKFNNMEVNVNITERNTFCRCPRCGVEVPIDLGAFWGDEDFDLFDTQIFCDKCAKEVTK